MKFVKPLSNIEQQAPDAQIEIGVIDLESIQSIKDFAEKFKTMHFKLDALITILR
jgi:hypothetical protein